MQREEERRRQAEALWQREEQEREERVNQLYGNRRPQGQPVEIVGIRISFMDILAIVLAVLLANALIFVPLAILAYIAASLFWPDAPLP